MGVGITACAPVGFIMGTAIVATRSGPWAPQFARVQEYVGV